MVYLRPEKFERSIHLEQFTIVRRGYDPEEVNKYVSTLEQVIKSYKDKDNAIKNAIISAQVAADNMVKNAKMQADEYKSQIVRELSKVSVEVERQRVQLQAFQDIYTSLIRKYLTEPKENEMRELFARLDDVDKIINILKGDDSLLGENERAGHEQPDYYGYVPQEPAPDEPPGLPPPPAQADYF